MSFTDPMAPWVTEPPPCKPVPLPVLILAAFAAQALDLREVGDCDDCGLLLCPDHLRDATLADLYEAAYVQVAAGSSEWADLAISLEAGMN